MAPSTKDPSYSLQISEEDETITETVPDRLL